MKRYSFNFETAEFWIGGENSQGPDINENYLHDSNNVNYNQQKAIEKVN